ncbi:hypothetical protein H5410_042146, partial [Solanum commersonii]
AQNREKRGSKEQEMKVYESPIPTLRFAELTCTTLCSSTRSLEGSASKGEEMSSWRGGSPSSLAISTNVAEQSSAAQSAQNRAKKASKEQKMKVCGSLSPTWQFAELTCTALCSITRSLEGSGSKGEEMSSQRVTDQFCEAVLYRPMI